MYNRFVVGIPDIKDYKVFYPLYTILTYENPISDGLKDMFKIQITENSYISEFLVKTILLSL